MKIGIVGMGRMGANIARRLATNGHQPVVYDRDEKAVAAVSEALPAKSLADLVSKIEAPRAVWVMLPDGKPTEATVTELGRLLVKGDVIIDGGNTHFKDDVRRARALAPRGIDYVDAGTSGGVW